MYPTSLSLGKPSLPRGAFFSPPPFRLLSNHTYSVFSAKLVNGFRLLYLRSPWSAARGAKGWTGEWGQESPLWEQYPDVERAVHNVVPLDDGGRGFWMGYSAYLQHFSAVHLNRICTDSKGILVEGRWV